MKRVIIICEGQTEKEFCEKILVPFFAIHSIYISAPLIKKSKGGIVAWSEIKKQINLHLRENAYVTLFIDFYGINDNHLLPNWLLSKEVVEKNRKIDLLQEGMSLDINNRYFIPYIQLHEFEALLFSCVDTIINQIPSSDMVDSQCLIDAVNQYDNPEFINDGRETAPSKRLSSAISGYNKVLYGHYLAESIGLQVIRARCGRFNYWIDNILNIA